MKPSQLQLDAEIEKQSLRSILDAIREFYQNPVNRQAYEAWKKQKEAKQNATQSHT